MIVEKNLPIPESQTCGDYKYPVQDMEVGDSIFEPGPKNSSESKVRLSAKKYGTKTGKKFSARKVEGGVRVWRIL